MYFMYTNYVMYRSISGDMPAPHSVKARGRHGTESLDLTIPAELKREHGISEGDVFVVTVSDEEEIVIDYERIHDADSA